ncbi:hypothetical protein GCM10009628_12200 [Paeniglutamicibacter kerguelensis]|uniref:Uncharacterized protein n=1 Tax=Paeniglutamicibacter kerguelensis TaxID=254788 RepID=A0ABS4XBI1_9MICC|nr:hypothetical protein [Paeniglutamicibacter kerguelensis]
MPRVKPLALAGPHVTDTYPVAAERPGWAGTAGTLTLHGDQNQSLAGPLSIDRHRRANESAPVHPRYLIREPVEPCDLHITEKINRHQFNSRLAP